MKYFIDRTPISKSITMTDEGYMHITDARIARTGIQYYLGAELFSFGYTGDAKDVVSIYRPEEEVFNPESLSSFEQQPVTDDHPPYAVTSGNFSDLAVGIAFNVRKKGNYILADLKITDELTIKNINSGKRQISNGYDARIEFQSGVTPRGESYSGIQRDIKGNHIAIVDNARCGASCTFDDSTKLKLSDKGETMPKVNIQGVRYEVENETLADAITSLTDACVTLQAEKDNSKTVQDSAVAAAVSAYKIKLDTLQAELDQANSNQITPEKLDAVIDSRMEIITDAKALVSGFDHQGKTCAQIKREVVSALCADSVTEDKLENVTYVDARFDALKAIPKNEATQTPTDSLMATDTDSVVTDTKGIAEMARKRKLVGDSIAYKFPAGARHPSHARHSDFVSAVNELMR